MTLIVGIKCSDGLVIGADGAATLGIAGELHTVLQPVAKLSIKRKRVIIGVSGPVGLSQLYADRVDGICNDLREDSPAEVCRKIRDAVAKDASVALQMAQLASAVVGARAREGALTHTLIALAIKGKPDLIQLDYQCCPELATEDLPFVAIGSGQSIADPFLAFLRRVFWPNRLPTLPEGRFAVMWTLIHAIKTAPGGIGKPIQMATLAIKGGQPEAKEVSEPELLEHEQAIDEAEAYLRKFQLEQQPGVTEAKPPVPPP